MTDGIDLGGWNADDMLNFRNWLESALVAKGAEVIGTGAGLGGCDIAIRLDGVQFSINAAPIIRKPE